MTSAFDKVNLLAAQVQEIHLQSRLYIADPLRNPLRLPDELQSVQQLIHDLRHTVHRQVPPSVYAHHLQTTCELQDQLVALERGYAQMDSAAGAGHQTPRADRAPSALPADAVREMVAMEYTDREMGDWFGCSAKTVYRRRIELDLLKRATLHSTTDETLCNYVKKFWRHADKRHAGYRTVHGWIKSCGIPCTRQQVRRILKQLEPDEVEERRRTAKKRRDYHQPFPNSMWHIDGHHKLDPYKFVIHGGIDGYSRLITFMTVSDNNRSETVKEGFRKGTEVYGWPQRVRADYGKENLGVREEMIARRGANRRAFIQGDSTRNQRIEQLWKDVHHFVVDRFKVSFKQLEMIGLLDRNNPVHLFCLHYVYLPIIQEFLDNWVLAWNFHHGGARGMKGRSPIKHWHLGFLSAAKNGFQFDHFPQREDAGDEVVANSPSADQESRDPVSPFINADGYGVGDQAPSFQRIPLPGDPHREVPRFANELPEKLYTPRFQAKLGRRFPPGDFDKAQLQFAAVLAYVYKKLRRWYPLAMVDGAD